MISDRQVHQTVARCVSAMVFYHDAVRSSEVARRACGEIRAIVGEVARWSVAGEEVYRSILRPVEDELIRRYGHELGLRLGRWFIDEFESEFSGRLTSADLVASGAESERPPSRRPRDSGPPGRTMDPMGVESDCVH
jgi:hypothetical protein